jgi:4-diphosphocytidyl-2-C-methyl-D-erythritol kinase
VKAATVVLTETAYAKVNLALHVRSRRADGYHEIETLFAFVDQGDVLTAEDSPWDQANLGGEFARDIDDPLGNLVVKAMNALPHSGGLRIDLEKRLPVAAGLGGGSADAGAVFRIMRRLYGLPDDWRARAERLGADVPACIESETVIGRGTGTELVPGPQDLAGTPVLLVNPRVPLATGPVFKGWDGVDRGAMPEGAARDIALSGRNDLESPAIALCPVIGEVLSALRHTTAWCVRMSGSGASCFALFDTAQARDEAQASMRAEWWTMTGFLR